MLEGLTARCWASPPPGLPGPWSSPRVRCCAAAALNQAIDALKLNFAQSQPTNPTNNHTGTGCIFHYDDKKPEGSGLGFLEADEPNFTGSYYSYTKAATESFLRQFPNVLTLRVRMPIVPDLTYPRNFITKVRGLAAWLVVLSLCARGLS